MILLFNSVGVMTSTGEKERQRSNSLDSKTRRRVLKTMPGPLYAITPIAPSVVLAEYQKRLDHRKAPNSDSNSNTSSGSSITSTDSSEETQRVKGQEIPDSQSTRYVMVRMQSDVLKDKPQQESCPVKVPDSKNDHVYGKETTTTTKTQTITFMTIDNTYYTTIYFFQMTQTDRMRIFPFYQVLILRSTKIVMTHMVMSTSL